MSFYQYNHLLGGPMAMLAKPVEEPGRSSDTTALTNLAKKPYLYQPEDYLPVNGGLSVVESHKMQELLLYQLGEKVHQATDKTDLKLVVDNTPTTEDDSDALNAWLASYCPIRFNEETRQSDAYCLISEQDKYKKRLERSAKVRSIKHTKHGLHYNKHVWEPTDPVKGWYLGRPPTLEQLYSRTRRHAEQLQLARYERQARIEELKEKHGWDKTAPVQDVSQTLYDEMFFTGPPKPANDEQMAYDTDSKANAEIGVCPEYRAMRLWFMGREGTTITSGLGWFFQHTGVPEDTFSEFDLKFDKLERERYHSWLWRRELLGGHIDDMTGLQKFFMSTGVPENGPPEEVQTAITQEQLKHEFQYELWARPRTEEERYQEWLIDHYEFKSAMEVPYKYWNKEPISMFDRKCHAYRMMMAYYHKYGGMKAENVAKIRNNLFTPAGYYWQAHTNRLHPIEAVGEPWGEWDREEKAQLVRTNNAQHAKQHAKRNNPNKGKTWAGLGLLPSSERMADDLTHRLARKVSEQSMNIVLVREVIRDEISDYTAAVCTEFEVAMEDLVERIENRIVSSLEVKQRHSDCPQGFVETQSGILIPDDSLELSHLKVYQQAKVA